MKKPVILIGVGEMGGVFARGFLKAGHPVYPVTRGMNMNDGVRDWPEPEAVIVAVGEKDLDQTLKIIPDVWRSKLVLIQNELLPKNWETHGIKNPTVISVWFEKKPGKDVKVIIPSPVYGPKAQMVREALEAIKIPCRVLKNADELLFELILKNLYILTTNIAGLKVGGTVGELWAKHQTLACAIADDVLTIQFHLAGKEFDRNKLIKEMVKAFDGDPDHICMGRSAPTRLERALNIASDADLEIPALKGIVFGRII